MMKRKVIGRLGVLLVAAFLCGGQMRINAWAQNQSITNKDMGDAASYHVNTSVTAEIPSEDPEPETPEEPDPPAEPEEPEKPTPPANPEDPVTPDEPGEQPEDPKVPDEPEAPETPKEPDKPAEPEIPKEPDKPTDPEVPGKNDTPEVIPPQENVPESGTPQEATPPEQQITTPQTGDTSPLSVWLLLAGTAGAMVLFGLKSKKTE